MATRFMRPISTDYFVIRDFLEPDRFDTVRRILATSTFTRRSTPMRDGEAISSMKLSPEIAEIVRSGDTLTRIKEETSHSLTFTPRTDENSISALRYSRPGDGIDGHYDGNVYIGNRWVGLLIVEDDGDAKLTLEDTTLATLPPNTLVLFQGDHVKHSVTRRKHHGTRVLLNILFCDVCALRTDPLSKIWSTIVSNFAFY